MLAPTPLTTTTWPVAGDAPDLLVIVNDQAETIEAQEALLHAYQTALTTAQDQPAGPVATGNGGITSATTTLSVTGTVGTIVINAIVGNTGNTTAPTVLGQISGTSGGDGVYLLSAAVTLVAVTALTFTPPPSATGWPIPQDVTTLDLIVQQQTAVIRVQTSLIQHYQDLLNTSQVPAPATGP